MMEKLHATLKNAVTLRVKNIPEKNLEASYFSKSEFMRITIEILKGIHFIHSLGFAHLDLKLDNIMVYYGSSTTAYGEKIIDRIKLIDLNQCEKCDPKVPCKIQKGTGSYKAPEMHSVAPFFVDRQTADGKKFPQKSF